MQIDHCHWSQEQIIPHCVYWCVQLPFGEIITCTSTQTHIAGCVYSESVLNVCGRMLGCYCAEGLADFRATVLSVSLCIGGLYCGTERPDVERVMQRNNKVFVPTAPMSLLSFSIALLKPFQTPDWEKRVGGRDTCACKWVSTKTWKQSRTAPTCRSFSEILCSRMLLSGSINKGRPVTFTGTGTAACDWSPLVGVDPF